LAHETSNEVTIYFTILTMLCNTHTTDASHQAPQDNSAWWGCINQHPCYVPDISKH